MSVENTKLQALRKEHGKRMPGWPRAIRKSYVELKVQSELLVELTDEIRGLREDLRAGSVPS